LSMMSPLTTTSCGQSVSTYPIALVEHRPGSRKPYPPIDSFR
jgi:hypothetical protein